MVITSSRLEIRAPEFGIAAGRLLFSGSERERERERERATDVQHLESVELEDCQVSATLGNDPFGKCKFLTRNRGIS
jgi:hypothetical protein